MNEFEIRILDFIQDKFACEFLDFLMPIISIFGDGGVFWIALSILFIIIPKTRKTGITMGCALLLGLVLGNGLLKNLIARTRPFDINTDFRLLVKKLSDYSFPSGHTLASFECASVLVIKYKKLGIPALILAVFIAFSRLYLYVHYPTDVMAGAILGTAFGFLAVFIVNKCYNKIKGIKKEKKNFSNI